MLEGEDQTKAVFCKYFLQIRELTLWGSPSPWWDKASDYKLCENGSKEDRYSRSLPPPTPHGLVFMLSLSGSQYWLHINHLGEVLENTHAWSHTKLIKSESLGHRVQIPVYFRSFAGDSKVHGSEKAQVNVDYETLCNYPVNLCLIR